MFFSKKYSDLNDEIVKIERPKESDFNVKREDAVSVYKKINMDYRETEYNKENSSGLISFFIIIGICVLFGCIPAFIDNSITEGIFIFFIGLVIIIACVVVYLKKKEDNEEKKNSYKNMDIYNEDMDNFIRENDAYNDKVNKIRIPYFKEMEKEIKKFDYNKLKETMTECYKRRGLQVFSTGMRKFGGVILRVSDGFYNIAVVIFPYDNPISGNTVQALSDVLSKIKPYIDEVHVISRFGQYIYGHGMANFLFKPYKIFDAFDIAKYIWYSNTEYYSDNSQIENKKDNEIFEENAESSSVDNIKNDALHKNIVKWVKLQSSSVSESYYNLYERIVYLKFKNGDIYAYYDVDKSIYLQFLSSPSKGKFVHREFYKFKYKRVRLDEVV